MEIDLSSIVFTRRGGASREKLTGPGSLSQNRDGEIELKAHVAFSEPDTMVALLNRSMKSEAGALVPDDGYHDIEATDVVAAVWDCGRAIVSPSVSFPTSSAVFQAKPRVLRRTNDVHSPKRRLRLYFFDQSARDWKGLLGGPHEMEIDRLAFDLTIDEAGDGQIRVEARSATDLPEAFERRLIEALQFVVGQSLHPAIVDEFTSSVRTLRLYGSSSHIRRVPAFPPLEIHTSQYAAQHVELLRCYLTYLFSLPDEGIWSPPSSFLFLLRSASEGSIDSWLIGICVAVEGLAGLIEYTPAPVTVELAKFQVHVGKWIKDEGISESSAKRITGLVGQLGSARPIDRMMSLVPRKLLYEADIKTWSKARNSAVHTRKSGAADLKSEKLQGRIDQLHDVYRLLYFIIFQVIGYDGEYTDYAERHFPVRAYPPGPL
ncbi:hypothetical protein [Novosphingobium sp. M1R2S20]|uniref:ApeA N-terminal domain-containing protein n=1 Tax=Novosphingobium rhizovicinum TaxID=3228928 RepID=A0ABV3R732_9SPHN